jgi:hypothetical protein
MMGRVRIIAVLLFAASCGSDDEKSSNQAVCDRANAKAAECGVAFGGLCDSPCVAQCVIDAQCAEFREMPPNPFYICQANCRGVSDPFFCKNGTQFLPKSEVCNGDFQCRDGSDEENCTDPPDAG